MGIFLGLSQLTLINITIHFTLIITLLALLLATLIDGYWQDKEAYKFFMLSIIITIVQCCLVTIYLYTSLKGVNDKISTIFFIFSLFLVSLTNAPRIMNIVYLIEEKAEVKRWIKAFVQFAPLVIGFLVSIYLITTDFSIFTLFFDYFDNIMIEMTYLFSLLLAIFGVLLVVKNRKLLTCKEAISYCLYLIIPSLGSLVSKWQFLFVNFTSTLAFFAMYVGLWQKKKYEIIEQEKKLAQIQEQLTESKTETMISQIQPHFLYNALSSIAALCAINPKKAQEVTINFSDYLRNNLKSITEKEAIPFERELKHTKLYVSIEQVRFDSLLNIVYDISVKDFKIPALTLQPIVENAIKHGVTKKENGGTIIIKTYEDEENYIIEVNDDGVGFDMNVKKENDGRLHLGVNTVGYRLKTMSDGQLIIDSKVGIGTKAKILIPKEAKKEK